jgi:hypothetical protein
MDYKKGIERDRKTRFCELCNYTTAQSGHWNRHIKTKKHCINEMITMDYKKGIERDGTETAKNVCICGKEYKHRQGLSKHQLTCTYKLPNHNDDNQIIFASDKNAIIFKLIEKITEQGNQITDLIQRVGNNNGNNSNNKHFNINIYLNNQCKNALSIQEFAKALITEIDDSNDMTCNDTNKLESVITNRIKKMEQIERPMHTHDKKWYVKDESEGWEDDDEGKSVDVINREIQKKEFAKLAKRYPNWNNSSHKDSDKYIEGVSKASSQLSQKNKKEILSSIENTCSVVL